MHFKCILNAFKKMHFKFFSFSIIIIVTALHDLYLGTSLFNYIIKSKKSKKSKRAIQKKLRIFMRSKLIQIMLFTKTGF
jgi:hypothetical protein